MRLRQDVGVYFPTSLLIAAGTLLASIVAISAFTWFTLGSYPQ